MIHMETNHLKQISKLVLLLLKMSTFTAFSEAVFLDAPPCLYVGSFGPERIVLPALQTPTS